MDCFGECGDSPAVAEQRDYYAYYLKKNVVVGAQRAAHTLLVPGGSRAQGAGHVSAPRNVTGLSGSGPA